MSNLSKSDLINKIKSEFNKKLKELEAKLATKHKELIQIERAIKHDTKIIDHSNISKLKSKKAELNSTIAFLKKDIKKVSKEKIKKLRKL
ncbi:MAG: hypothetical protein HWN81_01445 [Candidatus Lokiarchaeota archaeon]|nr:hypothetical protein [Candidatus Lokiarchaeota archaeon]